MFLLIIFVMIIMVIAIAALPQLTGLAKYTSNPEYLEKKREREESKYNKNKPSSLESNPYVYEAPDAHLEDDEITEEITRGTSSSFKGVRSTLKKIAKTQITDSDIPIKLELAGEGELKRRARHSTGGRRLPVGGVTKADPNSYDYDLDEFIEEENANDHRERLETAHANYGRADV